METFNRVLWPLLTLGFLVAAVYLGITIGVGAAVVMVGLAAGTAVFTWHDWRKKS